MEFMAAPDDDRWATLTRSSAISPNAAVGFQCCLPDVNQSRRILPSSTRASGSALRPSRMSAKGAVEAVIEVAKRTPVPIVLDLFRRVDLRKLNKRMMEGTDQGGAFDSMGGRRS